MYDLNIPLELIFIFSMYVIHEGKCIYMCAFTHYICMYVYIYVYTSSYSIISLVLTLISSTSGTEHSEYGQ